MVDGQLAGGGLGQGVGHGLGHGLDHGLQDQHISNSQRISHVDTNL